MVKSLNFTGLKGPLKFNSTIVFIGLGGLMSFGTISNDIKLRTNCLKPVQNCCHHEYVN